VPRVGNHDHRFGLGAHEFIIFTGEREEVVELGAEIDAFSRNQ
jgi:hypothetical protein